MSYDLTPLEDAPAGREVRIGWDGALDTFFLQALDEPDDPFADEEIIESVVTASRGPPHRG